jgi:hypothetical protein
MSTNNYIAFYPLFCITKREYENEGYAINLVALITCYELKLRYIYNSLIPAEVSLNLLLEIPTSYK